MASTSKLLLVSFYLFLSMELFVTDVTASLEDITAFRETLEKNQPDYEAGAELKQVLIRDNQKLIDNLKEIESQKKAGNVDHELAQSTLDLMTSIEENGHKFGKMEASNAMKAVFSYRQYKTAFREIKSYV
ncbi:uncharacterized protein [Periplaneta americana]|uniref:uncharacterized protein n=1 Tax=Periplaneta americana TaxID=6978 RepID=UPI0037E89086